MNNPEKVQSVMLIAWVTVKGGVRDRLVQGLILLGVLLIFSTGIFASFSMRQTFEVSINYGLSIVQIVTTLVTLFLGLNLLSQEIESKAGQSVLTCPFPRTRYVLGKFGGLVVLVSISTVILGICSLLGIYLAVFGYKDVPPFSSVNYLVSLTGTLVSCSILGAITVLFTSFATSAILPFLLSCATYAIGQSTQAVTRFLESGMSKEHFSPLITGLVKAAYYIFPNFSLFDFKVYAIYTIPLPWRLFWISLLYGTVYITMALFLASWLFSKRDLP